MSNISYDPEEASVTPKPTDGPLYRDRFQTKNDVIQYESKEYAPDSYSSKIWQLQRPVLMEIIRHFRVERGRAPAILDFACGTGRILSSLEALAATADGIDVSPVMVEVARERCKQSNLIVGDIVTHPHLLQGQYDVITIFRFLLNTEPIIRRWVLLRLRDIIHPGGELIVNVHGNSRSARHPGIVWRRWRNRHQSKNQMLNELSPDEAEKLLHECGFRVVRRLGFGILPPFIYRTPLRRLAAAVDKALAGETWWNLSIDYMYVCQPR